MTLGPPNLVSNIPMLAFDGTAWSTKLDLNISSTSEFGLGSGNPLLTDLKIDLQWYSPAHQTCRCSHERKSTSLAFDGTSWPTKLGLGISFTSEFGLFQQW